MPGSIIGAGASLGAASMQADAANHATDIQLDMYNRTRGDLLPYNSGGQTAFGNLMGLMGMGGVPNTGTTPPTSTVPGYPPAGNLSQIPMQNGIPYGAQALAAYNGQQPTIGADGLPVSQTWQPGTPGTTEQQNFATGLFGNANYNGGPGSQVPAGTTMAPNGTPMPYQTLGNSPMGNTGNPMLDALRNYPGYQFAKEEGINALDRSAASKGLLLSGGQLRAVDRYGTGLADQMFGRYFDQNYQLASLGENAAAQTGNAGSNAAQGAAQSQMAAGSAWASGIGGAANNIGGALPSWNPFGGSSGGGSTGNWQGSIMDDGTVLSDRRAKTDIEKIGRLESGLNVYKFRYLGSPLAQIGVMADEVKEKDPSAVKRGDDGLDRVDIGKVVQFKRAA